MVFKGTHACDFHCRMLWLMSSSATVRGGGGDETKSRMGLGAIRMERNGGAGTGEQIKLSDVFVSNTNPVWEIEESTLRSRVHLACKRYQPDHCKSSCFNWTPHLAARPMRAAFFISNSSKFVMEPKVTFAPGLASDVVKPSRPSRKIPTEKDYGPLAYAIILPRRAILPQLAETDPDIIENVDLAKLRKQRNAIEISLVTFATKLGRYGQTLLGVL
ncbi:hypothetical protein C8R41DRAFT_869570 [Lentinula lateritia]|uniref:Uncharacterized protein n=1 Tax=Lentinula lateritia TaxID=40482 RepID=A0ABQ8V6N4_9AGAR|nr:hypothetical protein C8R41DRAFT_869570 [Lentinula lateritia]